MKASDLVTALERHYTGGAGHRDEDSHATYAEVPYGAEGLGRRIDFLAVALWGSRGHRLEGHEIKVSRSDWLAELAQPDKAERWWQVTSRWWLVVPDASIVHPGELPDGWGLMVPGARQNSRTMKVVTEPSERTVDPPLWLLARLLLNDKRGAAEVRREIEASTADRVRKQEREHTERQRLTEDDLRDLRMVRDLRVTLGDAIKLADLTPTVTPYDLGRALAFVEAERRKPRTHEGHQLEAQARAAEQYAERLRDAAKFAREAATA